MNNFAAQESSLLQLFQEYQKFCLDKINDSKADKDAKLGWMTKIISDLFNQNEQLISIIMEMKQSSNNKSLEMHRYMVETAKKTVDIGQALSSYEIEMKKLSQQYIPSIIDYDQLLDSLMHSYEKENFELKKQNKILFDDIQKLNIELMQYKKTIYNLMLKSPNLMNPVEDQPSKNSCKAESNIDLIELFMNKKLAEQEENVNVMICASILDEIICTLEQENESSITSNNNKSNNFDYMKNPIDKLFEFSNDNNDDNDKDENEFIDNWCNILIDYKNNNFKKSLNDSLINDCRFLTIFSTVLKEIKHKNIVITNLKNDIWSYRKSFHSLYYRFIERSLQILESLLEIIRLFQDNEEAIKIVEKMALKIENEIRGMIYLSENNSETNHHISTNENFNDNSTLKHCQILLETISL